MSDSVFFTKTRLTGLAVAIVATFGVVITSGYAAAAVALGIALGMLAVVLVLPSLAIFAAVFLFFTNSGMVFADALGFFYLTECLVVGLLALAVLDILVGPGAQKTTLLFICGVGFYVLTVMSSSLVSVDFDSTFRGTVSLAQHSLIAVALVVTVSTQTRFLAAVAGLLAAGLFLSSVTVAQYAFGLYEQSFMGYADNLVLRNLDGDLIEQRFGGPVSEPNYYAQILLMVFPVALGLTLFAREYWHKYLFGVVTVFLLAAIVLTSSRGGLLALILVSLVSVGFRNAIPLVLSATVLVVGLVASGALPAETQVRLNDAFSSSSAILQGHGRINDQAIAGRVSEMLVAWHLFLENPWFGTGYATYEGLYQDTARKFGLMARGADRQAHSLFLEIMAERGLTGLAAFLAPVVFLVYGTAAAARNFRSSGSTICAVCAVGLGISMIGFLATSVFLHEAFLVFFWVLAALCFAALQVAGTSEQRQTVRASALQEVSNP